MAGERSLKQPGDLKANSDEHHASTDQHRSDEDFDLGLAAAESFELVASSTPVRGPRSKQEVANKKRPGMSPGLQTLSI